MNEDFGDLPEEIDLLLSKIYTQYKDDIKKLKEETLKIFNIENKKDYNEESTRVETFLFDKISKNLFNYFSHAFKEFKADDIQLSPINKNYDDYYSVIILSFDNKPLGYIDMYDYTVNNWHLNNIFRTKYGIKQ